MPLYFNPYLDISKIVQNGVKCETSCILNCFIKVTFTHPISRFVYRTKEAIWIEVIPVF